MGRRKKDDGTYLLAVGLFGAGWLVCNAVKVLFSMPKIPNSPPQSIVTDEDNEFAAFVFGIFFLIISLLLVWYSEIFVPLFAVPLISFIIGFSYRRKRLKKKVLQQKIPFVSNNAPAVKQDLSGKGSKRK